MLRRLIAFELGYHARQVIVPASALVFFMLGLALATTGFGASNVHLNAPYVTALSLGVLSLGGVFLATAFCANAALRDAEHGMIEIVQATGAERRTVLVARFVGAFVVSSLVLSVAALGMLAVCAAPWVDAARLGPVQLQGYAWPLLVLVLPNVFFVTTLLFAVATLTRSQAGTYVAGLVAFAAYLTVATITDSPLIAGSTPSGEEAMTVAAIFDPFGLSAFFAQTLFWTPAERETRLIALTGPLLWNRALWIGAGLLVIGGAAFISGRRTGVRRRPPRAAAPEATIPGAAGRSRPAYMPRPGRPAGAAGLVRSLLSGARLECRLTMKSIPFVVILLLWMFFLVMDLVTGLANQDYGAPSYASTGAVTQLIEGSLGLFLTIIVIYASAEVVWRERIVRMDGLVDATPAGNFAFYGAKLAALVVMLAIMITIAVAIGVICQVSKGVGDIDPVPYLAMYAFKGIPLLQIALLSVFVQTVTPNKYMGMLVIAVVYLGTATTIGERLGIEHYLFRYSKSPPVLYSDMNGFGHFTVPFAWFTAYWCGIAGLLSVVGYGLWRRGTDEGLLARIRSLPASWGRAGAPAAIVCAVVALAAGGFIYFNTNILNEYTTQRDELDFEAEYERTLGPDREIPQPKIVAVRAHVDLFPKERRLHLEGEYDLRNASDTPIPHVMVGAPRGVSAADFSIDGARVVRAEPRLGVRWLEPAAPLAPGDETTLRFSVDITNPGFVNADPDTFLVENGTFIQSYRVFPYIGYFEHYRLSDPHERRRRGLGPPERMPKLERADRHRFNMLRADADRVTFETTISTDADQIALAPGALEAEWLEGGRRHFRYRSAIPVLHFFTYVSGRYAVATEQHEGVEIGVYHHPAHGANVARMIDSLRESLDYFTRNFGPYPHPRCVIVEMPAYRNFAQSFPGLIPFSESVGFNADLRDPGVIDHVGFTVAHEVSHQWWGHQMVPANVQGAHTLLESLAQYSALMVLEKRYGREHLRRFRTYMLDAYLVGRGLEAIEELPLYRVEEQPYIHYEKGGIVMSALRDLLGEESLNTALRRLIDPARTQSGRYVTTIDLMDALYGAAPPALHPLIDDWMKAIIIYDLRVDAATAHARSDGRFEVTLRIDARRFGADGRGAEHAIDMDEPIDIGAFSAHPDHDGNARVLHLAKVQVTSGTAEITITVDEMPGVVAIDPYVLRIDRDRFDNFRAVEAADTVPQR